MTAAWDNGAVLQQRSITDGWFACGLRVQQPSDAQTVPTVAQTADATVQEATTDNATAAQPRADCGRSQPRDCLRLDNMPLQQHSDNPQLSLTTCHSAHGEETPVGSVHNRELVQPRDGHMSDDNNQQHHGEHSCSMPVRPHNCGLHNVAVHLSWQSIYRPHMGGTPRG